MNDKTEWQEANEQLKAEARKELGAPPTAEEMLAYSRGELSESEVEKIQDLLVAYPEVARMYGAPFPEPPREGDADAVSQDEVRAGWSALQARLGRAETPAAAHPEARRRRLLFHPRVPAAIAAALAVVFCGLFVQAESRARYHEREGRLPRILGAPQELDPDGNRGPSAPTMLQDDGEAYLLKLRLVNHVRHPHYRIVLQDTNGATLWTNNSAHPDQDDAFQIVIPHGFLTAGVTYRFLVFGVDGETPTLAGTYDVAVPAAET
jgi:hypothetical protein